MVIRFTFLFNFFLLFSLFFLLCLQFFSLRSPYFFGTTLTQLLDLGTAETSQLSNSDETILNIHTTLTDELTCRRLSASANHDAASEVRRLAGIKSTTAKTSCLPNACRFVSTNTNGTVTQCHP